jgi:hypothetical protein
MRFQQQDLVVAQIDRLDRRRTPIHGESPNETVLRYLITHDAIGRLARVGDKRKERSACMRLMQV